jgi:hypothetical protein
MQGCHSRERACIVRKSWVQSPALQKKKKKKKNSLKTRKGELNTYLVFSHMNYNKASQQLIKVLLYRIKGRKCINDQIL